MDGFEYHKLTGKTRKFVFQKHHQGFAGTIGLAEGRGLNIFFLSKGMTTATVQQNNALVSVTKCDINK